MILLMDLTVDMTITG